jgi:hypothetical protein
LESCAYFEDIQEHGLYRECETLICIFYRSFIHTFIHRDHFTNAFYIYSFIPLVFVNWIRHSCQCSAKMLDVTAFDVQIIVTARYSPEAAPNISRMIMNLDMPNCSDQDSSCIVPKHWAIWYCDDRIGIWLAMPWSLRSLVYGTI